MDEFVHGAEEKTLKDWEALKRKYENKTATPHEQMQVGGFYRMQMVFKLLTQDFIERNSEFAMDKDRALKTLFSRISAMSGLDQGEVASNMEDLIAKGYIQVDHSREDLFFLGLSSVKSLGLCPWRRYSKIKSFPCSAAWHIPRFGRQAPHGCPVPQFCHS